MARPDPHPPEVFEILRRRSAHTRIAVVGASNDPNKYGNIAVHNLMRKGYTVLPVNLHEREIAGLTVHRLLADIDPPPDLVVVITPPASTRTILDQAAALQLPAVWLQDGSFDDAILERLGQYPFRTVYDACVMVVAAQY